MLPSCCKSSSPAASGSALKSRCCCCCYYCLSVCLYSCLSALASTVLAHTHTYRAQSADSFLGCCCFIPRRFLFVALPCECTSSVSGAHYDDDVAIVGKHTHTHTQRRTHTLLLTPSFSLYLCLLLIPPRINFLLCSNCKKIINLIL